MTAASESSSFRLLVVEFFFLFEFFLELFFEHGEIFRHVFFCFLGDGFDFDAVLLQAVDEGVEVRGRQIEAREGVADILKGEFPFLLPGFPEFGLGAFEGLRGLFVEERDGFFFGGVEIFLFDGIRFRFRHVNSSLYRIRPPVLDGQADFFSFRFAQAAWRFFARALSAAAAALWSPEANARCTRMSSTATPFSSSIALAQSARMSGE